MTAYAMLKRTNVGDRRWLLSDENGLPVAEVAMTGERGRDDYPWDVIPLVDLGRHIGPTDSLRAAVDEISARWAAITGERTYTAGLPVIVTVDLAGRVTFRVDLSEVREGIDETLDQEPELDEAQVAADLALIEAAAEALGNEGTVAS